MERFCHLRQTHIKTGRYCTERSDPAHDFSLITAFQDTFMYIQISGIYSRISQCQKHHIFSLFQIRFHCICSLIMIVFQYCPVFCHRHGHRNQFFFIQFWICSFYDLISDTGFYIVARYCDHRILTDQTKGFQCQQFRISRSHSKSI